MRKMILLAVLAALAAMMLAATPAMANHKHHNDRDDGFVIFSNDDDDDFFGNRDFGFNRGGGVSFELGDVDNDSGDVDIDNATSVGGSNNNVCLGQSQFGQTGNFTNQQGVELSGGGGFVRDDNDHHNGFVIRDDDDHHHGIFGNRHHDDDDIFVFDRDRDNDRVFFGDARVDDIDFRGPDVTFAPQNETTCDQDVEQAAAASSWGSWW